ncbi:MAG: DUF402 domain-containing protein [Pyrinomonadaceae bacterium]
MSDAREILINSRKYDNRIRRSWKGGLISESDELLIVVGKFYSEVEHDDLGCIKNGTVSFEHFWLDRWYNVFRFHEPEGQLRNYYCNIAMPPTFADGVLDYVDLDLDVVVWADLRYEIVDRDDFEENAVKYGYPDEIKERAEAGLCELVGLIEKREFPFSDLQPLS